MDRLTHTLLYRLRTKHLKTIEVLGRVESMRAATNELNITQPAVTKLLQDLENILEVKLFERSSTGISATPVGLAVIEFARKSVSDIERFAGLITNLKLGGYGSLRIGTLMAGLQEFIPKALGALKNERPLMTIHLLAAPSNQLLDELNNNTIDIAVARLTESEQSALFNFEPLLAEEVWVFAHSDHPMAMRKQITLEELFHQPWVLQSPMSPLRTLLQRSFTDISLGALPNWVETNSIYTTLKLVEHAGMIAALPRTIVEEGVNSGDLVRLPVSLSYDLSRYGILTPKHSVPNDNARFFADILRRTALENFQECGQG